MLKGIVWLGIWRGPPIVYWALLPHLDPEYARLFDINHFGLLSIPVTLVGLGLGRRCNHWYTMVAPRKRLSSDARLLRSSVYYSAQCSRASLAPSSLSKPRTCHRDTSSMVAMFLRLQRGSRLDFWSLASWSPPPSVFPIICSKGVEPSPVRTPQYISTGDVGTISGLPPQPGTDVVLARSDLSPLFASRGHHRVVVGHWL